MIEKDEIKETCHDCLDAGGWETDEIIPDGPNFGEKVWVKCPQVYFE